MSDLVQPTTASTFRNRAAFVETCDLDPASLTGSWFHKLEDDEMIWQGQVVAEPQPGVYLCQIDRLTEGAERVQRIFTLKEFGGSESVEWRFYDTSENARIAYANWLAARSRV